MKTIALSIFVLTYILLLVFPKIRAYIALASGLLFVVIGIIPLGKVLGIVDWNVILMIAGTMGLVHLVIESKMPELLADLIIDKTPNVKWAVIFLALFAGIISAFIDNVATVLIVAPIALTISKRLKISPVPAIIAIAVSSNLQGAATLVGDTTSILLGGYANLDFLDFFFFKGRIGIFWVVQFGALASTVVLLYVFRKEKQPISPMGKVLVEDYFPTYLLITMIGLLILASFFPSLPYTINGIICVVLFIVGLLRSLILTKDPNVVSKALGEIDYFTILLLIGLFIVVGGIAEAGIIEDISEIFIKISGDNIFVIYTLIVWASVFFSAFIDNIPYVATMLPVVAGIASILQIEPYLLYFGLIIGATLGGNMTPIGASANITAIGILRKDGYEVSAKEFMKIGVPFTLVAVITGYILIWLLWS
ncbi:MAG: arsenic transporter [Tissierellia bacterium]|jgi:Na+/H+ antiporter NhaD/arsenite permease-like protein|nr:arsenic transporter [Tissierellia bacterium]